MPIIIQHNAMVLDTLALAVNDEFHYPRFFQTMPYGPNGKEAISAGFFAAAMTMDPSPRPWRSPAPTPSSRRTR